MKLSLLFLSLALSLAIAAPTVEAMPLDCFARRLARFAQRTRSAPKTLDEMNRAFEAGLIPDFADPHQKAAFDIYREMKLGTPGAHFENGTAETLARIQVEHPELQKIPMAPVAVTVARYKYPHLEELAALEGRFVDAASELSSYDYWINVVGLETARKAIWEPHHRAWASGKSGTTIPEDSIEWHVDLIQRVRAVAEAQPGNAGLRQAMVDIVHDYAARDSKLTSQLRHEDGRVQLAALRAILQRREDVAVAAKYSGGYEEMLRSLGIAGTSGLPSEGELNHLIAGFVGRLEAEKTPLAGNTEKTVRALSIAESPWRSCLGKDCSSREYLEKALENRFLYFTATDAAGHSDGNVTVVLGSAMNNGTPVRAAMIDKIQNIDSVEMPFVLEAIRRSLSERGYTLSIPVDIGGHNGISNLASTREFISTRLQTYIQQRTVWQSFQPAEAQIEFPNGCSRAHQCLDVKPLLPMADDAAQFRLLPKRLPWRVRSIDLDAILKDAYALKTGSAEDKKKYLAVMTQLWSQNKQDPAFVAEVSKWMTDPAIPLSLKNAVLTTLLELRMIPELMRLRNSLTPAQQGNLVQNWLQTPRHAGRLGVGAKDLLPMSFAHEPSLRAMLKHLRNDRQTVKEWIESFGDANQPYVHNLYRVLIPLANEEALAEIVARLPKLYASLGKRGKNIVQELVHQINRRDLGGTPLGLLPRLQSNPRQPNIKMPEFPETVRK